MNRREWVQSALAAFGFVTSMHGEMLDVAAPRVLAELPPSDTDWASTWRSANYESHLDTVVPAMVENLKINFGFPCDTLEAFAMTCLPFRVHQPTNHVLHVALSARQGFALTIGGGVFWCSEPLEHSPFIGPITALHVTNRSHEQVRLKVSALYN